MPILTLCKEPLQGDTKSKSQQTVMQTATPPVLERWKLLASSLLKLAPQSWTPDPGTQNCNEPAIHSVIILCVKFIPYTSGFTRILKQLVKTILKNKQAVSITHSTEKGKVTSEKLKEHLSS